MSEQGKITTQEDSHPVETQVHQETSNNESQPVNVTDSKSEAPVAAPVNAPKSEKQPNSQGTKAIEMVEMKEKPTISSFELTYDSELKIVHASEEASKVLHIKEQDLIGHSFIEFVQKDYLNSRDKDTIKTILTKDNINSADVDVEEEKKSKHEKRNRSDTDTYINNMSRKGSGVYDTYSSVGGYASNYYANLPWSNSRTGSMNGEEMINMDNYSTTTSQSGELVVEMNELYKSQNGEWMNTGIYKNGFEESSTKNGYGAVSLNGFAYLRHFLEEGVVLLDQPADDVNDCIRHILDEFEDKGKIDMSNRTSLENVLLNQKSPLDNGTNAIANADSKLESCKVFITTASFVPSTLAGLIRLSHPLYIDGGLPLRYILVVIGKEDSSYDYHDIGRAFSLMMAQKWFFNAAKKIESKHRFIKLMDTFLRRCVMLPPMDTATRTAAPVETVSSSGCCSRPQTEGGLSITLPHRVANRANNYLSRREHVMKEQSEDLLRVALEAEPSAKEIDDQLPPEIESHLAIKDMIWGGIIFILCVLVAVLLNTYNFRPSSDGLHGVGMTDYPMEMVGGFKSVAPYVAKQFSLPESPRGLYEIKIALERYTDAVFTYQLFEKVGNDPAVNITKMFMVSTSDSKEVEDLEEVDVRSLLHDNSMLYINVILETVEASTTPLAFTLDAMPMNPVGEYRIIIGIIILVLVYGLLLAEVVHRTVCAFIGAFFTLLLIAFVQGAPELSTAVAWIDSSTLCLLFGMMVMVQMLSTTGLFEWCAVKAVRISGGRPLVLNIVLCVLTGILSAFLDNVTTMLLFAPVTIELCNVLNVDPIPFLIPEVLFSNIGGTATMIGDPPNIMIGNLLSDYVQFIDFITDVAPCCLIVMVFAYLYLWGLYHKSLPATSKRVDDNVEKKYKIKNMPLLLKAGIILLTVIILLFLHSLHGIDAAYLTLAGAFSTLLLAKPEEIKHTFELLEWETLLFFAGLFVMIEGMNELGVIRAIGEAVANGIRAAEPSNRLTVAILIILWVSGIASSILDNIPFTATMIPIVQLLHTDPELQLPIKPLAWALALGACLGGNGTLVGASANLVTAGIAEHHGHKITFLAFLLPGFITLLISLVISTLYLLCRYVWFA
ncbi:hypothetical protein WA158_001019 [Blastocystis sp. Blastoise]